MGISQTAQRWLWAVPVSFAGLVYANALDNPFVYDDYSLIVENRSLADPMSLTGLVLHNAVRPLINLSYAVDRLIWGPAPFGFHLTNVLLHMVNTGLLYLFAATVTRDRVSGAPGRDARPVVIGSVSALLFAVHPMMTQAVGYISGRSEVLCATWLLLVLFAIHRWTRTEKAGWAVLAAGLWMAALATKETAAMLPIALLGYELWLAPTDVRRSRQRLARVYLPLIALAATAAAARVAVLVFIEHTEPIRPHADYALVEVDVVRQYLSLMAMPREQSIFHAVAPVTGWLDPRLAMSAVTLGGLIATIWWFRRREGLVSFGLTWFLLMLVPSSVLVTLDRAEPMAEHRVYIASLGLFLVVGVWGGWLADRPAGRRLFTQRSLQVAFVLWLVILSGRTVVRNAVWDDGVDLWTEAAAYAPGHWLPLLLLGEELQRAGRCDLAGDRFRESIRLHQNEETGYRKLGGCLIELGRLPEARAAFQALQAQAPTSVDAANGLAVLALANGQSGLARHHFEVALERDPANVQARQGLATLDQMFGEDRRQ